MLTYVDGSALSRFLGAGDPRQVAGFRDWLAAHHATAVTSPLALTELRRLARGMDADARELARQLGLRLRLVRFSDQAMERAAMTTTVLDPFSAIALGVAVAHPEIGAVATYDPRFAQVAVIHGLTVVAPGQPDQWWLAATA